MGAWGVGGLSNAPAPPCSPVKSTVGGEWLAWLFDCVGHRRYARPCHAPAPNTTCHPRYGFSLSSSPSWRHHPGGQVKKPPGRRIVVSGERGEQGTVPAEGRSQTPVVRDEVSLNGYRSHLASESAPAPLTTAEQELKQLKVTEMNTDVNVDTRQRTLQGIAFPVQDDALRALRQLQRKDCHYVQLKLDIDAELITLVTTEPTGIAALPSRVPSDSPRWHFFLYQHTHEGSSQESLVFIYSMPGGKCSIKERMLYSSCKGPFLTYVEEELGIQIARKVEIDDGGELTAEFLYDEIHPRQHTYEPAFRKPPGPARTRGGGKRIVRNPADGSQGSS
ncbi:twinfilin-2-like [Stegostoma tigrinum]|uniref:twinfilin-2-like n=1 Tax=Stegostoma tigrinum TaxID=3053191 RepID=UPI00286FFAA9|nr:twinfilin-2-like [Stegostoma tigrinum]